jgi:hypothetical protein
VLGATGASSAAAAAGARAGAGAAEAPSQGGLQELEDRIRDAVRARRSVSEDSQSLLARLFK